MRDTKLKKRGLAAIFRLCPARHLLLLISAGLIALHLLTRDNKSLMGALSRRFVRPVHSFLARLSALVPFSLAELLVTAFLIGLTLYLLLSLFALRKPGRRAERVYITTTSLLSALASVYALFSLLWGVYYYGDSFTETIGLSAEPVSVAQLETVTEYFAALANDHAALVARDASGCYAGERESILERSAHIYDAAEARWPCLAGPDVAAKPLRLSRLLSHLDYTGFFFPFTGEANVNADFPPTLFASTVAHELAHQRGVAQEQEANFTAVLASLESGDADYCYSAALLAYIHLGNALYSADREAWERISAGLCPAVRLDFARDSAYWEQFDSPVQQLSNTIYESFLQSYDQTLGLKSYGACVDLLVNYYYPIAAA